MCVCVRWSYYSIIQLHGRFWPTKTGKNGLTCSHFHRNCLCTIHFWSTMDWFQPKRNGRWSSSWSSVLAVVFHSHVGLIAYCLVSMHSCFLPSRLMYTLNVPYDLVPDLHGRQSTTRCTIWHSINAQTHKHTPVSHYKPFAEVNQKNVLQIGFWFLVQDLLSK